MNNETVGTALTNQLEQNGIEFVFGIPGVHTVELYRGLAKSKIRHITPRHEQAAGFMADGYARISGKPGVCFVISGPGLTNILTAMAQARSDSVPMLVISGVNNPSDIERKKAPLHSLPNQSALAQQIALESFTINAPEDLIPVINNSFSTMCRGRRGPVHIQIPVEIMPKPFSPQGILKTNETIIEDTFDPLPREKIQTYLRAASKPVIIIGGGARTAKGVISDVAEALNAPVISTTNARDILGNHDLHIPASPSLQNVRKIIAESDLVIAIGTEMGSTDFDFFEDNLFPEIERLIRVDIDAAQLAEGKKNTLNIKHDSGLFCTEFLKLLSPKISDTSRNLVQRTKSFIKKKLSNDYANFISIIDCISRIVPDATIVGDSTQISYAGNFYCQITKDNRWFNSATGFGTLGYAPAAAIGAKLAKPNQPVICIVGDGGVQFCLSELGTAVDENAGVIFLIWNNREYKEIRTYMQEKNIQPIGTNPTPPNFELLSKSYGVKYLKVDDQKALASTLKKNRSIRHPLVIEIFEDHYKY
ncbi:MAG: 5-guanidino-2-oxopentanoate decarboxylase [Pseudomonadota bacterium]|nr:5-guanidino-2-oxopentanoate decarboxylase [Pseudomonadota bacterium]